MIFVTGGTGFLGAHLLAKLSYSDKKIIASKRTSSDLGYAKKVFDIYAPGNFEKISWVDVDFFDTYELEDLLHNIEEVYHCASQVSFHEKDHDKMIKNNVTITGNLVDAALFCGIKKFMFASSVAALGRSAQAEIIDESRIWKTDPVNTKYGLSKYKSEMEVWRGYEEGLPVIVVNPSMILGYCRWTEGTGRMFEKAYNGMKFYTKGYTGWVDVNDVCDCMIRLMQKETFGERYVVVSETQPYRQIFDWMAEALNKPKAQKPANMNMAKWLVRVEKIRSKLSGKEPLITTETLRNASLECTYVNDKIKKELNFTFKPVKQTIEETANLFKRDKGIN